MPQAPQTPVSLPISHSDAPKSSPGGSLSNTQPTAPGPQPKPLQPDPVKIADNANASFDAAVSCKRELGALLSVLIATTLFVVTSWFARAMFSRTSSARTSRFFKHIFHVGIGDTLTVLAVLSSVMTRAMAVILDHVLESIQWSLTGRTKGVSVPTVLGLSPSTGGTRTAAIWAAGFVLPVNTSLETVCGTVFSYPVWAGIGQFNGSYVKAYVQQLHTRDPTYNVTVLPYTSMAPAYNLISNPLHSSMSDAIDCNGDECDPYLVTGGLALTRPWQPTNHTNDPVILIKSILGTQTDFRHGIQHGDLIEDDDCDLFHDDRSLIAMLFCVAPSHVQPGSFIRVQPGSFIASVYVCMNGTQKGVCISEPFKPNLTTTFATYSRQSQLVIARSNYSILSANEMTPGIPTTALDLQEYRSALRWLLNFTAADVKGPSSIIEYSWSAPRQLTNDYWSPGPRKALQSLVAYPLWLFNVNNAGNIGLLNKNTAYDLPEQFHVSAAIATPRARIVVNQTMFIIFVILECLVLISAWATVIKVWSVDVRIPKTSAYPLIDFAFKTKHLTPVEPVSTRDLFDKGAAKADSKSVRDKVNQMRVSYLTEIQRAAPIGQTFRRRAKHSSSAQLNSTTTP